MRALLIEDDRSMARAIERVLRRSGHSVYSTDLGEEGFDLSRIYDYDIILLDMNLPDMTGPEVLRKLRTAKVATPVLVLSGLDQTQHKVTGLELGAADYLTKPFDQQELLARINAIVRRTRGHATPVVRVGVLDINLEQRSVSVSGELVRFTEKEFSILELLALRCGRPVTKDMLLDHLYGEDEEAPTAKVIDVFLHKIRKKIANATGGDNYIRTAWGRGYTLQEPSNEP